MLCHKQRAWNHGSDVQPQLPMPIKHIMKEGQREQERNGRDQYHAVVLLHRTQQVQAALRLNFISVREWQLLLAVNR